MNKLHVAILAGGPSLEHEISLISAANILKAIDMTKYVPHVIGITKEGEWRWYDDNDFAKNITDAKTVALLNGSVIQFAKRNNKVTIVDAKTFEEVARIDVVFSILHGNFGEDGKMQGYLDILGVPYVGCGVTASALCMDKIATKQILDAARIQNAKYRYFHEFEKNNIVFSQIVQGLGLPFFVKPARAGSSVGVSKVKGEENFATALDAAFACDSKILLEESISGREVECSILGRAPNFTVSPTGEVVLHAEFYSYEAKYIDPEAAEVVVPTKNIKPELEQKIRDISKRVAEVLELKGLSRIDFRVRDDGEVFLNEVNTLPGFTNISMYPKHFQSIGISYPELIDRLIQDALEK